MICNYTIGRPIICFILFIFISALSLQPGLAQVYGCKDPQANNYNSSATVNDGSCTYNQTNYTPPIKADPMSSVLIETSGLQWAAGYLWSFNDGGGDAAIYKIDTISNAVWQTVNLAGATNVDWEDIAFDGTHFYVGDFGNNANGARTDLKIYKFPVSAIPDHNANPIVNIPSGQIEVINFTYSDQAQPPVASTANNTKWDCEAMLVDNGKIHLFSKNWVDNNTTHYIINNITAGSYVAAATETLATNYLVTAADKSPGFGIVTLLGYQVTGFANHFMHVLSDYRADSFFTGNKRRLDLPNATVMGQGEGIAFRNSTYGYISNEKFSIVNQKLRAFNIGEFITQSVLALDLVQFDVRSNDNKHKISWSFATAVDNLIIQHSIDAVNFTPLYQSYNSLSGVFDNAKISTNNYYRLAWKRDNGFYVHSPVITVKEKLAGQLSNFSVFQTSKFIFNSNTSAAYTFRFSSTDGKVLQTLKNYVCNEGVNIISLPARLQPNSLVIMTAQGVDTKVSKVLFVGQ